MKLTMVGANLLGEVRLVHVEFVMDWLTKLIDMAATGMRPGAPTLHDLGLAAPFRISRLTPITWPGCRVGTPEPTAVR